ncbi:tetratricopeptide repeat protein [Symbioplanes lichenis]|uniref:tetratricopeptide repeat protein n=1 Tax=Symbioplanes lichenis TaxID=1629072 RepID=UPI002738EECA|nr:tetratricopeptide repeat protein [Actinoplanes lichenis]
MARRARELAVPLTVVAVMVAAVVWFATGTHRAALIDVRDGVVVILEVVGLLLLLGLISGLLVWLCQPLGVSVENCSDNAQLDGDVLARTLTGELRRIKAVHEGQDTQSARHPPAPLLTLMPVVHSRRDRIADSILVPTAPSRLAGAVVAIGSIDVAGTSLPLGALLTALKQAWPLRPSGPAVTARLFQEGDAVRLTVHLQPARRRPSLDFATTACGDTVTAAVGQAVRTSAARVAHALSPRPETIAWQDFERLTTALESYQEFQATKDKAPLRTAAALAHTIRSQDDHRRNARALIYNLGAACLEARDLENAELLLRRARRADPDDAVIGNAFALALFEQRRFAEARDAFLAATKLDPATMWDSAGVPGLSAHPWNGLGNTYVELAEYPKAIEAYRRGIELCPGEPYLHNGLGNAYLQQHLWEPAEEQYREASRLDPHSAYPWHGLGNLWIQRNQPGRARKCHEKALELDSTFAPAWNGLGEALARLDQPEQAVQAHRKAIGLRRDDPYTWRSLAGTYLLQDRIPEAFEALETAKGIDDQASYVWRGFGDAYLRAGSPREAKDAYRKALDLNPRDAAAWDGLARTTGADGDGDIEERLRAFEHAAEENPREPFAWNQVGEAYYQAGAVHKSVEAHERALALDPGNSFALDGLGKAYLMLGEVDAALDAHERARASNAGDAYASHSIGAILLRRGDYAGALREHRRAVHDGPGEAFAWNGLGDACERLRRYDDAAGHYRTALGIHPDNAYAHNGLARIAVTRGDYASAVDSAARATRLAPHSDLGFVTLGDAWLGQGAYDKAVEAYREGTVQSRLGTESWDGLGRAYSWLGDYANAGYAYEQGLEADPEHWRLLLGRADVVLGKEIACGRDSAFEEIAKLYDDSVRAAPSLALAARVRLAVLAHHQGDTVTCRRHAAEALAGFAHCWAVRPHPDADLHELAALAHLLGGRDADGLGMLRQALADLRGGARLDSVRTGLHRLVRADLPGVEAYRALLAESPAWRNGQIAPAPLASP